MYNILSLIKSKYSTRLYNSLRMLMHGFLYEIFCFLGKCENMYHKILYSVWEVTEIFAYLIILSIISTISFCKYVFLYIYNLSLLSIFFFLYTLLFISIFVYLWQDLASVPELETITKEQPGLVEIRNVGSWIIHRCYNCSMYTHAVHKEFGAALVLINSNIIVSLNTL